MILNADASAGGVVKRFSDAELERICPFHQESGHFLTADVLRTIEQYNAMRGPCAMRIANEGELLIHAGIALLVSAAHYEIATRERWPRFPNEYCGRSSTAVMLSLFEHGYPNATTVRADVPRDHNYVVLPYALDKEHGVIIADPTFGQMPNSDAVVLVTRRTGLVWEYRPGWAEGADLYPDMVLDKDRVKALTNTYRTVGAMYTDFGVLGFEKSEHRNAANYFSTAFSRCVNIPIPSVRDEILKKLAPW